MDNQFIHHFDKLKKRLYNSRVQIVGIFDKIVDRLEAFGSGSESYCEEEFQKEISKIFESIQDMEPLKKVCQSHRESYSLIGRLGKEIESTFLHDLEDLNGSYAEPLDAELLDSVISDYLISQGMFDCASMISPDSCLQKEKISKIHQTMDFLEAGDIETGLKWMLEIGSASRNVVFSVHKLKFIECLRSGNLIEALEYARANIHQFTDTHLDEIKHLMGACVFVQMSDQSPYSDFFKDSYKKSILKDILTEWSRDADIPTMSCIQTILNAGEQVIPELIPLAQIAGKKFWTTPIPTQLKLDPQFKFHSTFVCPVSKEVATPENPPMMLPCGHLIAKNSMDRLLATSIRSKFKCPTCPVEITEKDAKKIFI
jgi:E3 ubiquitin-protein transferase RMND5